MKFPQSVGLFDRLLVMGVLVGYWTMLQADHHVASDWEVLFDGQSTEQFRAFKRDSFPSGGWKIEEGQLRTIKGGDEVDIITKDQYRDFELVFQWKVTPGGNSGVIYRVSESFDRPWHTGPEYQVLDDSLHQDGKNPLTSAGSFYALVSAEGKTVKPVGEYNASRIVARGSRIEHRANASKWRVSGANRHDPIQR
ncbi:DUF1080 domain-containing protein [Verrucomicrobia bacterium]|nr:DUF1080 domain-containing protein [Verrucomicrobiota bacterium]